MSWERRFRARQYLKGSLWIVPLSGAVLGVVLSLASVQLDKVVSVPASWEYSSSTALTILTTIVAASVGLTGFVVTVSVLVVQTAISTFSARYMRVWYRDPWFKTSLAALVGTFTLAYTLLRRVGQSVPDIGVTLAGFLLLAAIVLFLVFLDRSVQRLRPVKVAAVVAAAGRSAAAATAELTTSPTAAELEEELLPGDPALSVRTARAGSIQAIHRRGLIAWAERHDCALVLPQAVGDFVASGATLVEVHRAPELPAGAERELRSLVALGVERTIDQDAAFALRVMVDIAIRALSPAVNDPTTAVQVIDHLGETLVTIGRTPSLDGRATLRDAGGRARVFMPEQRWEDYLSLAVTEIRQYGATSIQVVRRLRVLFDDLQPAVLPEYAPAVARERERLEGTAAAGFGTRVEDADLAAADDRQGIGGPALAVVRPR